MLPSFAIALAVLAPASLAHSVKTTIDCHDHSIVYNPIRSWHTSGDPRSLQNGVGSKNSSCSTGLMWANFTGLMWANFTGLMWANFTVQIPATATYIEVVGQVRPDGGNVRFLVDGQDSGSISQVASVKAGPLVSWSIGGDQLRPDVNAHTIIGYKDEAGNATGYIGFYSVNYYEDNGAPTAVITGVIAGSVSALLLGIVALCLWFGGRCCVYRQPTDSEADHTTVAKDLESGKESVKEIKGGAENPDPTLVLPVTLYRTTESRTTSMTSSDGTPALTSAWSSLSTTPSAYSNAILPEAKGPAVPAKAVLPSSRNDRSVSDLRLTPQTHRPSTDTLMSRATTGHGGDTGALDVETAPNMRPVSAYLSGIMYFEDPPAYVFSEVEDWELSGP